MFEFLFKYPAEVFSKGTFVLLGAWPKWLLALGILGSGVLLLGMVLRGHVRPPGSRFWRSFAIGGLQWATVTLLLLLLWEPAISVTALRPQQNIVAVVIDDSRSMGLQDGSNTREEQAADLVKRKLAKSLGSRFQVRLYKLDHGVERIESTDRLQARGTSTQIGLGLRELADEAGTLPIGSIVLLSDGSDNAGGVDSETLAEIRRRRLPINTIGFGRENLVNDVELDGFELSPKAMSGSKLQAQVTLRQNGFSGKPAHVVVLADGAVVENREISLNNSPQQTETVEFEAGKPGVKTIEARIDPLPGEANAANNRLRRILSVDDTKRRILYVEGEPRWDFKFIRRAADDDPGLQIVSMLRTTQNKIYRQGIASPAELADGFPSKPEDLFQYQGLMLGSIESAFFTPTQQQMIKDFVDRRGGGLVFLGGRWALADGGYNAQPFSELLPVNLPQRKNTFQRSFVVAELTEAGRQSTICRIESDSARSAEHWEVLPYLANYQDPGTPKPGAVVLANVSVGGKKIPLLATENYGRGRTAVLATGGTWRWRMQQPATDTSQETFWRQLLRWSVAGTPSQVTASTPNANLEDEGRIQLRTEVRDKQYLPISDADVSARVISPDGSSQTVPLRADPTGAGVYSTDWTASVPGAYVAEISATRGADRLGTDVLAFHRENGVAENFHKEQNRDLLQRLADQTGGHYYKPGDASRLSDEIAYSQAGVTSREMKDLWNMPAIFAVLLLLRSAEWLLRRRWGVL